MAKVEKKPLRIKVQKFQLDLLSPDSTIVVIGKRRTGKSWLVRDILYHFRKIPLGIVISPTEQVNPFFKEFIPDTFIHEAFDPEFMKKVWETQEKRCLQKDLKTADDDRLFVVMDDCLAESYSWKRDVVIRKLFMQGRHISFFFIMTLQYAMGIPPDLRTNIDYTFIFANNSRIEREKIWKNFCNVIPTFPLFNQIMDQCTQDHMCLVVNNNASSARFEDCIFWYKADTHPPFRCGTDAWWQFHSKHKKLSATKEESVMKQAVSFANRFTDVKNVRVVISDDHRHQN